MKDDDLKTAAVVAGILYMIPKAWGEEPPPPPPPPPGGVSAEITGFSLKKAGGVYNGV